VTAGNLPGCPGRDFHGRHFQCDSHTRELPILHLGCNSMDIMTHEDCYSSTVRPEQRTDEKAENKRRVWEDNTCQLKIMEYCSHISVLQQEHPRSLVLSRSSTVVQ
jgi:hypothetical protein